MAGHPLTQEVTFMAGYAGYASWPDPEGRARGDYDDPSIEDVTSDELLAIDAEVTDQPERPFNLVDEIIAYEGGEADGPRVIRLFQHLVDTGQAWTLQGSYGRTAARLIEQGLISERNA
jgi:hypothetical protein